MTATLPAPAPPEWMTRTAPLDFLNPATWRDQPRDEHGQWVKADKWARRRAAIAALDAGEHITIHELPEDPAVTRESRYGGAVVIYRGQSTTVHCKVVKRDGRWQVTYPHP